MCLKKLAPTRLLKNPFFESIYNLEQNGGSTDQIKEALGKGRAKRGMFEGDMEQGELEIGQVASYISQEQTAQEIIQEIISSYTHILQQIKKNTFDI